MKYSLIRCGLTSYLCVPVVFALFICLNFVVLTKVSAESKDSVARSLYSDEYLHSSSQVLSRKRRYLTFPSGSSFQLVYDLIIGVVDYTNYLILGVTSALAWQLPTEAPSEIVEHLEERLKEGTIGFSRNDTIENIQYVDTNKQKPAYITSFTNPYLEKPKYSYYYNSSQFHPPMHTKYYTYNSSPLNSLSSNSDTRENDIGYFSNTRNPFIENKTRRVSQTSSAPSSPPSSIFSKWSQWWNKNKKQPGTYKKKPYFVRKHRIFPVFAKRSVHDRRKRHGIEGPLTKLDNLHLRYHRSSRHDLYDKIERYLEINNKNGHQCVLKALCETGQKAHEVDPTTFVGEIMRAIFTLPESEDPVHVHKLKLYDEAHAHEGNCTERFSLCGDSVWTADFVL